jgi:Uma2 family endonuclease
MAQAAKLGRFPELVPSGRTDCIATARMSLDEWLAWEYEGGLTEWVDGEAYVYMSNTAEHQRIVGFLSRLLGLWCEWRAAGTVMTAPYAMLSRSGRAGREPDLMFISREHGERVQSLHLVGAPDLIVEVVSDDSVTRDLTTKLIEYQAAGVAEYWIVDSRPGHQGAQFFVLDGQRYREVEAGENGMYRSTAMPGFWLDTAWLWDEEPRALAAFEAVRASVPNA